MSRVVESQIVTDNITGEILSELKMERTIKRKAKEGAWVKLFLADVSRTYLSKGDERTVLGELIVLMDKNNIVDISPRKKQDIVINNIYLPKDETINTEDQNLRAKAGRRFSQLVKGLVDSGIVAQQNTSTYIVDTDYVEYGYGDGMTTAEKKANFMTFSATLNRSTGILKCKVGSSDTDNGGAIVKNLSGELNNE